MKSIILYITINLMMSASLITVFAQDATPSIDPNREVIVMFKDGVVAPPVGKTSGTPVEFQIPSQGLRSVINSANVEAVSRLIPDFKPTVLLRYQNGVCYKQYEDYEHRFQIRNDSLSGSLVSGMMSGKYGFYLLSDAGLYKASSTTTGLAKRIPFPITWSGFPWKLRGNGVNDLIIVGEYFMLGHFNGSTFRHFYELHSYGRLTSVDQKNNFVVAVGYLFDPIHSKGIIIRGRR
ncbi:MAG: hypothetical protein QME52_00305 [Bacteroidota bacterium]|nr:hypothetical protein [Bacteroidota bacterium]